MKRLIIGLLSGLAVLILFFPSLFRPKRLFENSTLIGKVPPDFEIQDVNDGKKKMISDISNKKIVINFFASWCNECSSERKKLLQLKSADVFVIGVVFNDSKERVKEYLRELNPYDFIAYDSGQISLDYGVTGVPETFVIYDHKIVRKFIGPIEIREVLKSFQLSKAE